MIMASITSSSGERQERFDATAYFEQAEYQEIESLIFNGLAGSAISDDNKLAAFLDKNDFSGRGADRREASQRTLRVDHEALGDWLRRKSLFFLADQIELGRDALRR